MNSVITNKYAIGKKTKQCNEISDIQVICIPSLGDWQHLAFFCSSGRPASCSVSVVYPRNYLLRVKYT